MGRSSNELIRLFFKYLISPSIIFFGKIILNNYNSHVCARGPPDAHADTYAVNFSADFFLHIFKIK